MLYVLLGLDRKRRSQPASPIRPAILSPRNKNRTPAALVRFCNLEAVFVRTASPKCVSVSGAVCSAGGRDGHKRTQASVRMVFMINWRLGPSSCNYRVQSSFFPFFFFLLNHWSSTWRPRVQDQKSHLTRGIKVMCGPSSAPRRHGGLVRSSPFFGGADAFASLQSKKAVCIPEGKACETDTALPSASDPPVWLCFSSKGTQLLREPYRNSGILII